MAKTIRLFLASSSELENDRKEFELLIGRKNKALNKKNVFIELIIWEDFIDAMSKTRLQDEYNKVIKECDIFVMLFFTKVGKYTLEEFETAFGQFKETGKPFIYTYFKKANIDIDEINEEDINSLFGFKKKLKLLGHFLTPYQNIEGLKHHFGEQLEKLEKRIAESAKKVEQAQTSPDFSEESVSHPLIIPEKYSNWVLENSQHLDIDKIVDTNDQDMFCVKVPQIFVPLYTTPPWYKGRNERVEKQELVNIEKLVTENDYLLIQGQAGSGKTTLIKHIAYTIVNKDIQNDLDGYLPVWIVLNELQDFVTHIQCPNSVTGIKLAEELLEGYFQHKDNGLNINIIKSFCNVGRAIFLLDGLDEMAPQYRKVVIPSLSDLRGKNKMVITSRPHGIDGVVLRLFKNRFLEIDNLIDEQIREFIHKWFKFDKKLSLAGKTPEQMMSEIQTLEESGRDIRRFIETPLMLTAVCVLYHYQRKLPEQRVELYDRFFENLIHRRFDDAIKVKDFLMRLAFDVHTKLASKSIDDKLDERKRLFDKITALSVIETVCPEKKGEFLEAKFKEIEEGCGLLSIDNEHNQYKFWHLSFQEFLAARNIKDKSRDLKSATDSYWNNSWYDEVIKLLVGYLSYTGSNASAHGLVEDILNQDEKEPFRKWFLASQSLMDIHPEHRQPDVVKLSQEKLLSVFRSDASPKIKADAGEILGWLDDPRDLEEFVPIEGGKYKLKGLGTIDIKAFKIAKYPVTNQWYKQFIEAKV